MGRVAALGDVACLSPGEERALEALLSRAAHDPPEQADIWSLLDQVWDELGCDNLRPDPGKMALFYSHPVWLLNGLFIEADAVSMQHRHAMSDWLAGRADALALGRVLDYGGGFATFGRLLARKRPELQVEVLEPHPTSLARHRGSDFDNLRFIASPGKEYDAVVCIDVLEHLDDPLRTLAELIGLTKTGGALVVANCFYPAIKCHLPRTFHLRYSFGWFASMLGLRKIERCRGSHAVIYRKVQEVEPAWARVRGCEKLSQKIFPGIDLCERTLRKVWSAVRCGSPISVPMK